VKTDLEFLAARVGFTPLPPIENTEIVDSAMRSARSIRRSLVVRIESAELALSELSVVTLGDYR